MSFENENDYAMYNFGHSIYQRFLNCGSRSQMGSQSEMFGVAKI